jgi:hypothetical protein
MTRLLRYASLALAVFAFSCIAIQAQDPAKIVDQYVKAAGGSRVLSKIQTETLEGTFTNPADGKPSTYTLSLKLPNRYYCEFVLGDKNLIEAYNGKSAWHQTTSGEISTLLGQQGQQLEAAALYYNARFLNLKKSKLALSLIGHAQVRGKDALQVEVSTTNGVKREAFFDAQTHLVVKESGLIAGLGTGLVGESSGGVKESAGAVKESGGGEEEIFYDDYRSVDGVQIPHKIELHRGADIYSINITRTTVNGTIGERTFDFPKKLQVQLPDLKALFKEIDENQKVADKIRENYAGTRVEEETELQKDGKAKKTETREYTFFYLDGDEVSTLVKKDGKSLSDEEQKKENEKTQKEIENIQKRQAKKDAKEEKAKEEGKDKKDDDDVGIETFLRACQFVNPRRERFRGQDVLVFDFEPNPEFQPHKMEEKVVHELAGVVWVDEKAHEVARLEAYFVGDFHIAGGVLANLQKGTSFVFEQAFFNNEVWLPTYMEAHVGVRLLLVKGFNVNAVTRYSDYKRFNVETLSTINQPKPAADPAPEKPHNN